MKLLEMSISAGVLILLLAVLRRGNFWNLTKRTVMMLWMVVLARLLLPGSLPIRGGIAAPVFGLLRQVCSLHTALTEDAGGRAAAALVPEAASFGTLDPAGESLLQYAAGWLWLAGAAGTGIYFAYSYWKEYRLLAQALPLESVQNSRTGNRQIMESLESVQNSRTGNRQIMESLESVQNSRTGNRQIMESCKTACRLAGMRPQKKAIRICVHDRIRSPLVFGIIRQKIVIPKRLLQLEQAQMQYVLTHEMVHIRRHDNLWKLLSAAAVCIHWFNPAVWLMYILSARDLELSCDERVLSVHGSRGRQEYAATLLTLAQNQMGTTLFCSGFLENPVKERIVAIMKYRKLTGIGVLCGLMLFTGASSVFATNEQPARLQEAGEMYAADAQAEGKEEKLEENGMKQAIKEEKGDTSVPEVNPEQMNAADTQSEGREKKLEENVMEQAMAEEKSDAPALVEEKGDASAVAGEKGDAPALVEEKGDAPAITEVNPEESMNGVVTVKFPEPVNSEGLYFWYKDEDGAIHLIPDGSEKHIDESQETK